jgi:hypothetical protein
MVEDPRINFAISDRGMKPGLDHLGLQVDTDAELKALREQVATAEIAALDQPQATCCVELHPNLTQELHRILTHPGRAKAGSSCR